MLAYTSQFTEHCLTFLNSYAVYVIYFQAVMELHDLNKTYLYNTHIQNCLGSVRFVLLLFFLKKERNSYFNSAKMHSIDQKAYRQNITQCYKRFLLQINAVLLIFQFIKNSFNKLYEIS